MAGILITGHGNFPGGALRDSGLAAGNPGNLIWAGDSSPFPTLTRIKIHGTDSM